MGILSPPVLARLHEAGLAAGPRMRLVSGRSGALLSPEPVSLQNWLRVQCTGRLGSPRASGSTSQPLSRPRACGARAGPGSPSAVCAPGSSAQEAPGAPSLQPLLLLNPRLRHSPWALLLARVHVSCCTDVHTPVPQLTRTSSTRSHLPPCRGLGLRLGRLLIWSGVREALSQARGKRVVGWLPRPPRVSGSIAGGPGCVSLWPCEHSRHPGGPHATSPTGTELAVLAADLSPESGSLQGPWGSPGLRSCGMAKGSW